MHELDEQDFLLVKISCPSDLFLIPRYSNTNSEALLDTQENTRFVEKFSTNGLIPFALKRCKAWVNSGHQLERSGNAGSAVRSVDKSMLGRDLTSFEGTGQRKAMMNDNRSARDLDHLLGIAKHAGDGSLHAFTEFSYWNAHHPPLEDSFATTEIKGKATDEKPLLIGLLLWIACGNAMASGGDAWRRLRLTGGGAGISGGVDYNILLSLGVEVKNGEPLSVEPGEGMVLHPFTDDSTRIEEDDEFGKTLIPRQSQRKPAVADKANATKDFCFRLNLARKRPPESSKKTPVPEKKLKMSYFLRKLMRKEGQ
nr:hypothetical protein Iba_chr14aCG5130 [Ipomoea batatas]